MNKTAREWFEELPSPIRGMAVENAEIDLTINQDFETLEGSIISFLWIQTKQDYNFWLHVYCGKYDEALALLKPKTELKVQGDSFISTQKTLQQQLFKEWPKISRFKKHTSHRHKLSPIKFY